MRIVLGMYGHPTSVIYRANQCLGMIKRPTIGAASFRRVLLAYDRNKDGCATASRNRSALMAQVVTSDSRAVSTSPIVAGFFPSTEYLGLD
jgi:hypothetical protein